MIDDHLSPVERRRLSTGLGPGDPEWIASEALDGDRPLCIFYPKAICDKEMNLPFTQGAHPGDPAWEAAAARLRARPSTLNLPASP